ncbi:Uncharacterised protein [Pseudomonas aeruginosa]|nr:Uncharacterised protein [Pseudomonas aeruginosa]
MAERAVPLLAVLLPAPPCANPWFLESRLDRDGLRVSLQDRATLRTWRVEFVEVEGVRQLDAGDLLEFWPVCAAAQGWLYRIEQGGWLDQECRRAGFGRPRDQGHRGILHQRRRPLPERAVLVAAESFRVELKI